MSSGTVTGVGLKATSPLVSQLAYGIAITSTAAFAINNNSSCQNQSQQQT